MNLRPDELEIEGRRIRLSNLDRVLWPATGLRKGDMIDYYRSIAPVILPHLRGRPLTLGRFPMGVHDRGWYQSNCRAPDWLPTQTIVGRAGQVMRLCVVNDAASLVWVANQGTVELHPFLAYGDRPQEPTVLAFDLDPGPPAGLADAADVALRLRSALAESGLAALAKTSGSIGLHVFVPLNGAHTFDRSKAFARAVAGRLASEGPDLVVDVQRRSLRAGRVLIDWLQNDPTRSTVAVYSLRATPVPSVSTPVTWEEVEHLASGRHVPSFGPDDVLDRVEHLGDLFAPVLQLRQTLPAG